MENGLDQLLKASLLDTLSSRVFSFIPLKICVQSNSLEINMHVSLINHKTREHGSINPAGIRKTQWIIYEFFLLFKYVTYNKWMGTTPNIHYLLNEKADSTHLLINNALQIILWWWTKDTQYMVQLVQVMFSGENWSIAEHFSQNTANRPDINWLCIALPRNKMFEMGLILRS